MLSRSNYEQAYVDHCRQLVAQQSRSYRDLLAVAGDPGAGAAAAFEPRFCAGMVLAIDAMFMHRQRALEGKDGNPINEVRMLSNSILVNDGVLAADSTIKYRPESSVLKYGIGDEITLDHEAFSRLATAYFDEIERRFV